MSASPLRLPRGDAIRCGGQFPVARSVVSPPDHTTSEAAVTLGSTKRPARYAGRLLAVTTAALMALTACGSSDQAPADGAKKIPADGTREAAAAKSTELGAGQLPGGARQGWKAAAARSVKNPKDVQLNECTAVHGATSWRQLTHTGKRHAVATQDTFTFADQKHAQSAYKAVVRAMGACQARSRALQAGGRLKADAVVAPVVSAPASRAWARTWTAINTLSADGHNSDRLYAAHRANTLTVLQVTEPGTGPGSARTAADRAVLTALAQRLGSQAAGRVATNPRTGDLYKYGGNGPKSWSRVGGPGRTFAVNGSHLYGLSPDGSGVYEWTRRGDTWKRIGGAAANIYAGGAGLFATNPRTGDVYKCNGGTGNGNWSRIGGPGRTFVVSDNNIYGLSPNGSEVFRWTGRKDKWSYVGALAASG
ncbi:hypothetical protein ACWY4P_29725 [Streptomyces sp. LZ34]